MTAPSLTVLILTLNEAGHIRRAIESVRAIAREVIVIDSFSGDGTTKIAEDAGARVLRNRFVSHAKQIQWGIDNAGIVSDWILRLDADEIIEPDLAAEIKTTLPKLASDVAGVNLNRKHIFLGRWIKHGGRYPVTMLRLWRNGQGRVENRWMDEHILVWGGRTVTFKGGFCDHNLKDLTFFTSKHNDYATREAAQVMIERYGLSEWHTVADPSGSPRESRKGWIKRHLYHRLPFWLGPCAYFIYRYVIQLGFLDGKEGLVYHFLQGFWYRFLVGAKVIEYEQAMRCAIDDNDRVLTLSRLTGLDLVTLQPQQTMLQTVTQ